jgi:hypothetical protein
MPKNFDEARLGFYIRFQLIPEYEEEYKKEHNGQTPLTKNNEPFYTLSDRFCKENVFLVKQFKKKVILQKETGNLGNNFNEKITTPKYTSINMKANLKNDTLINEIKSKLKIFLDSHLPYVTPTLSETKSPINSAPIISSEYEKFIDKNNLYNLIDLHIKEYSQLHKINTIIKEENKPIKVQFSNHSPIDVLDTSNFYINGSSNNPENKYNTSTLQSLFVTPLKYTNNKIYMLERIEKKYPGYGYYYTVELTYKNNTSTVIIKLNEYKGTEIIKESLRKFFIMIEKDSRNSYSWRRSGGKSRRNKKIAKKRHTRKH